VEVERFVLAEDVQMPAGRRHLAKGTPVAFTTLGMQYAAIRDKLRREDPGIDQVGQAAVVLDAGAARPSGHDAGLRN
jgi:hypothetical protein